MPEFELNGAWRKEYRELSYFVRGYIEAMFFSAPRPELLDREPCPNCGQPVAECDDGIMACDEEECGWKDSGIPESFGFSELTAETISEIVSDCSAFEAANESDLDRLYSDETLSRSYDSECAGRDFWFSRNGHGVGFWDRGFTGLAAEAAERLTQASHGAGEIDLYLTDDDKVCLS